MTATASPGEPVREPPGVPPPTPGRPQEPPLEQPPAGPRPEIPPVIDDPAEPDQPEEFPPPQPDVVPTPQSPPMAERGGLAHVTLSLAPRTGAQADRIGEPTLNMARQTRCRR